MLKKLLPKLVLLTAALALTLPAFAAGRTESGISQNTRAEHRVEQEQPIDLLETVQNVWDWVRSSIIGKKGAPQDSPGSGIDPNGGHLNKPDH